MSRVLFCTLGYEPSPVGGAERQARLQAEALARRGHRVEVVSPRWGRTRSEIIDGIRVHRLPRIDRRPFRTVTYLPVLFAWLILNLRRFDLVHVHLANLQADVVGLARVFVRVPAYVKLAAGGPNGEVARMRPVAWATRYIGIRSAERVQAISAEIESDVLSIGVRPDRIVRIPNGLPTHLYRPASEVERTPSRYDLGLPDGVIVLWAGRFARYKGVLDLLAAWGRVGADRDATLVIVGEPAVDAPVELPPTDGLIVRSWSDSIVDYYRAADIYVHPSHADGMPNVVLEAMGCGLAVIATRVAAVPEMIEDGVTGVLVDIGDIHALADAIERLIADPGERTRLGRAAAQEVTERYAIERVVDAIAREYEGILGRAH